MSLVLAMVMASCQLPPAPALGPDAQAAACELLEQPPVSAGVDRQALEALLADPAFAHARDRKQAALELALERLRRWLMSFFESSGAFTYARLARVVVLVVALAVGAAGVLWVLRRRRPGQRATRPPTNAPLALEEPPLHLARARAALGEDPRAAIREGLLALLSTLERRQLARPDRVKTNHELADELPSRGADPALTTQVRALLDWYDGAFYSLHKVDEGRARAFVDEVAKLAGAAS